MGASGTGGKGITLTLFPGFRVACSGRLSTPPDAWYLLRPAIPLSIGGAINWCKFEVITVSSLVLAFPSSLIRCSFYHCQKLGCVPVEEEGRGNLYYDYMVALMTYFCLDSNGISWGEKKEILIGNTVKDIPRSRKGDRS